MGVERVAGGVPRSGLQVGRGVSRRGVWADVDLEAIRQNAGLMVRIVAPARLCGVVKANAYGHGAVPVARAALDGGASMLAVALLEEAIELRDAGVEADILMLQELPVWYSKGDLAEALAAGVIPTVCTSEGIERLAAAARAVAGSGTLGGRRGTPRSGAPAERGPIAGSGALAAGGGGSQGGGGRIGVHLKVDTGMHRIGCAPGEVPALVRLIDGFGSELRLEGMWSHLAVADSGTSEDREYTERQIGLFRRLVQEHAADRDVLEHLANSAAAIAYPDSCLSMIRSGIALYGESPSRAVAARLGRLLESGGELRDPGGDPVEGHPARDGANGEAGLVPALSLKARVSHVSQLERGERISYGLNYALPDRAPVATVPVGYADGVRRSLFAAGGEVLIRGRRCPIAGTVTMDQLMVDCRAAGDVVPGDEVVLIGRQDGESITASDVAARIGTIGYEVLSSISARVPRRHTGV